MTAAVYADARPRGLNIPFRPGNTLSVDLPFETGELTGRTFTSTLGGVTLDLAVIGDTMTIEASAAQTAAVTEPAVWLLTETTGGASNDLLIGTWTPSDRPGTPTSLTIPVVVGNVEVGVTVVSGQSSIVALAARLDTAETDITAVEADVATHVDEPSAGGAHGLIVHRWEDDGWDPFTERFVLNQDGDQLYTPSVVGRRGRITASADTSGNHREFFLHGGTSWADGEITGIIYAPSNWDTGPPLNRPQPGFVCRAQEVPGSPGTWRGFVVSLDIAFGTSGMNADTWQGDGVDLTLGSGETWTPPSINLVRRRLVVRYVARIDAFDVSQYRCFPDFRTSDMWGLANGDVVNIAGMVDSSFNRTGIAVANVQTGTGFFQVVDTTANGDVDAVAGGTVDFTSLLKSHFPRMLSVRLVDAVLHAKHWRPEEPEPDWADANHVAALSAPTSPDLPEGPGLWGVVAGHVHDSAWLEYGDLTFRRR